MSIRRGLVIIIACGMGFGLAGALLGIALGHGAPDYYRSVFRAADDPGFNPVQVGLGLGISQGLISGLIIGSVVLLATAMDKRPPQKPELDEFSKDFGESDHSRSSWMRRVLVLGLVLAAMACSGVAGFVVGAIALQVQTYHRKADHTLARIRPVLEDGRFAAVRPGPSSDGRVVLLGTVGSEPAYKALEERVRTLFGDETAEFIIMQVSLSEK